MAEYKKRLIKICENCKIEFKVIPCYSNRRFCSKQCSYILSKGENNNRYIDGRVCDKPIIFCKNCQKETKGRSKYDLCFTCSMKLSDKVKSKSLMSEETKNKIGKKSKEKFTDDFKKSFRKKMEDNGEWIPFEKLNDYSFYRKISNWTHRMIDVIDIDEKTNDILKLGFFNQKTNTKGFVRDHKFSRKSGFNDLIFPEILRHPCNCSLIIHGDNVRKHHSKSIQSDSIQLSELFDNIYNYKGNWDEHQICLDLIYQYKEGKRYDKKFYINKIEKNEFFYKN